MASGHKLRAHAFLSASGADKWIHCAASPNLEKIMPKTTSSYADEGTLAHELGDAFLRMKNNEITEGRYMEIFQKIMKNDLYSDEMPLQVEKYTDYVMEQFNDAVINGKGAAMLVESRLDFSRYVPEGFGTGDTIILQDKVIEVVDLKYGRGVPVYAEENSQLMLYGLGALEEAELTHDIKEVRLTIVQPRLDSLSTWTISKAALIAWGENTVKYRAKLAFENNTPPEAGKHCRWCRAKAKCQAFADYANEIAAHEFAKPALLEDNALVEILERIPLLQEWAKSVSEYMHIRAKEGHKFPGYKMVETTGNRKWLNEDDVIDILAEEGFEPHQYLKPVKLKGLTDIGNLVSKDFFDSKLKSKIIRPQGPPALVKDSDKRPAMGNAQAELDFADPLED